jgi:hypothetical protein
MDTVSTQDRYGFRHLIAAAIIGVVIGAAIAKLLPSIGIYISFEECAVWATSRQPSDMAAKLLLQCNERFPPK